MNAQVEDAIAAIDSLNASQHLSIIKLGEPLLLADQDEAHREATRISNASSTAQSQSETPTPASLEADLRHYKELFTKLRFSYVEQVTKEKFLRAVVGDPPLYILASENAALESHLLSVKASLKAQKTEVADLVTELETQGRDLCQRYQEVQLQRTQLESLPEHIAGLERTIETLRNAAEPKSDNPVLTLPLPRTLEVLSAKEDESARLDEERLAMRGVAERKQRELAQLQNELGSLQAQKTRATTEMADAQRRKAEGISGLGDDLEQRGRWLRGVEITLRSMLEACA